LVSGVLGSAGARSVAVDGEEYAMGVSGISVAGLAARLIGGVAVALSTLPAPTAAAASAAAASCTVKAVYDVQAQDNRDSSQVGAAGLIYTQTRSIYPGQGLPGPRRSVGILNASGGYVLFGWVRDSFTTGVALTYMEFRTASGSVGSTLGALLGNKAMKDQTWHAFKVRFTGHGHWSAYFDGASRPLYTTPNLGFSQGHPFLRVLRTNCDNGGTAEMKNLVHLRTATSAGPWRSNTCRLDTDPGKHLEIVSNSHIKVPGGQKANGCAGTTHG
jgi:hypothetical protein